MNQTEHEVGLRHENTKLAAEIEERKRAERKLDETRNELALASRLAAVGELAATVSHELGQPISAMNCPIHTIKTKRNQSTKPCIRLLNV